MTTPAEVLIAQAETLEEMYTRLGNVWPTAFSHVKKRADELRAQATSQPVEEQAPKAGEREAFEAWHQLNLQGHTYSRYNTGAYVSSFVARDWWIWQARSRQPEQVSEPVAWQYRESYGENTVKPGWDEWKPVTPRYASMDTIASTVAEIQSYVDQGKPYQLRALYTSPHPTPALPADWVAVPREPTQAMLDAGYYPAVQNRGCKSVWGTMLAALPPPPHTSKGGE